MTKDEIRQETPLSVTPIEAPIFIVLKDTDGILYKNVVDGEAELIGLQPLEKGDKVRLLACSKTKTSSSYQWGDGNLFVQLDNSLTSFLSGNLGDAYEGEFELKT